MSAWNDECEDYIAPIEPPTQNLGSVNVELDAPQEHREYREPREDGEPYDSEPREDREPYNKYPKEDREPYHREPYKRKPREDRQPYNREHYGRKPSHRKLPYRSEHPVEIRDKQQALIYALNCISSNKWYQPSVFYNVGCKNNVITPQDFESITCLLHRINKNPNVNFTVHPEVPDTTIILAAINHDDRLLYAVTIHCHSKEHVRYLYSEKKLQSFLVGVKKFFVNKDTEITQ
jgi:hypothetical protein